MRRANRAIVVSLLGLGLSSSALAERDAQATSIAGVVADERGQPLVGAVVSVFGSTLDSGALTAVTDATGRFEVPALPPGLYRLRAYLAGFLPSPFAKVLVEEGMDRVGMILMSLSSLAETAESVTAETNEIRTIAELKWILQHGKRNILRDEDQWIPVATASARAPAALFEPHFAVSGEFGVRGADFEQGLDEFPGAGAGLDARLAFARLFIPTSNDGRWLVSAQLLESALSSWAGRAEYETGNVSDHTLRGGVTYGNYMYGDLQGFRPPEAALTRRVESNRSTEWFGSAYASDSFLVGSTAVTAGLSYQYFDYLETPGHWSPQLTIAQPIGSDGTVLRGQVDYRVQAPGGEDIGLLSRVAYTDVYGPSPMFRNLRAETTGRVQLGLEQQLSERTRVAVRLFQENADDQLIRTFLEGQPRVGGGHYSITNGGDFRTRGMGVSLFQSLGAVQGTLGYTYGRARTSANANASHLMGVEVEEDIHDVTTTIATSIDRTRTRFHAVYRFIAHPRLDTMAVGAASGREFDTRFSVQVYQLLPFVGWNGTRFELMVAVRNLFYEDLEKSSLLDELAVIDVPRRVLGGVTVRF